MDQLKITLELLYDLLRFEKKREDLQKLESTFYADVVGYLREKKVILEQSDKSEELFGQIEREKLQGELRQIKRIIREIYEKREKKIIDIALNKSKTGSEIIDTSAMLIEEKVYYDRLLFILDSQRKGVMHTLLAGETPLVSNLVGTFQSEVVLKNSYGENDESTEETENPEEKIAEKIGEKIVESGKSRVKIVIPVPSFVWKDLKVYGPFDKGEETTIFTEVADLLVRKGRAIKVA